MLEHHGGTGKLALALVRHDVRELGLELERSRELALEHMALLQKVLVGTVLLLIRGKMVLLAVEVGSFVAVMDSLGSFRLVVGNSFCIF